MARVVPESTRQRYLRTEVRILIDGAWTDPEGAVRLLGAPLFVLTAYNPDGLALELAENEARDEELTRELAHGGVEAYRARGQSSDGSWAEEGWLVVGGGQRRARALGRQFGQDAIFKFTAAEVQVLGCFTAWTRSRPLGERPDGDITGLGS